MEAQMQKDVDSSQGSRMLPNLGFAGQAGIDDSGVSSQLSDVELTAIATLEREVCLPIVFVIRICQYIVFKQHRASDHHVAACSGLEVCMNPTCLLPAQAFIFLAASPCLHQSEHAQPELAQPSCLQLAACKLF